MQKNSTVLWYTSSYNTGVAKNYSSPRPFLLREHYRSTSPPRPFWRSFVCALLPKASQAPFIDQSKYIDTYDLRSGKKDTEAVNLNRNLKIDPSGNSASSHWFHFLFLRNSQGQILAEMPKAGCHDDPLRTKTIRVCDFASIRPDCSGIVSEPAGG